MRTLFTSVIREARGRIAEYARALRWDGQENHVVRTGIRTFIAALMTGFPRKTKL